MPHVNNVNYSENKLVLMFLNTKESMAWLFSEHCAPFGMNNNVKTKFSHGLSPLY